MNGRVPVPTHQTPSFRGHGGPDSMRYHVMRWLENIRFNLPATVCWVIVFSLFATLLDAGDFQGKVSELHGLVSAVCRAVFGGGGSW